MAPKHLKRTLEDLDEDPEDDDYGQPQKRSKTKTTGQRRPQRRRPGADSDSEELDESDDSIVHDSAPPSPIELNDVGRPVRRRAVQSNYKEPESEDASSDSSHTDRELVVTLKYRPERWTLGSQSAYDAQETKPHQVMDEQEHELEELEFSARPSPSPPGGTRAAKTIAANMPIDNAEHSELTDDDSPVRPRRKKLRSPKKRDDDESSEFQAGEEPEDEDISQTVASSKKGSISERPSDSEDLEVAEELADLKSAQREHKRKRRRSLDLNIAYDLPTRRTRGDRLDYTIRPEMWPTGEDDEPAVIRRKGAYRSLWDTRGPFGFSGGPAPPPRLDSDTSDDERIRPPLGMTPTAQVVDSGPTNHGRYKDRKSLADTDPLGVDQNVSFDGVGGLASHINQLKEMVILPLLYPEVFQRFHVTPPRGVLFHGPPGTGKTLLARALANSVSSQGKQVTFYMRKGADTLNKYVGEAERQLRLLFEDARKNQPSIIFFDEIDGLAPVRSSKQDQIHATIVTTLLALMDGMDGRGQVIVIGATNRPDTVDAALRRPGRFDREFYFPLPHIDARRAIIDIHTRGWEPALSSDFKDQLAALTNGYGGADLRALCTEAALNAVQGTYPQIYNSTEKLLIDPSQIKVLAKDFMISVNRMAPSSQRAVASNAAPLDPRVEPLLRDTFGEVSKLVDSILPRREKTTALEEAEYDDRDEAGFEREMLTREFDSSRIFRPRLLIYGKAGMGQNLIGPALLHKFERLHVQSIDFSRLYSDSSLTPQAVVIQTFIEARRHKPSILYIPDIHLWEGEPALRVLSGLLLSLAPTDPVLLLATINGEPSPEIFKSFFQFSEKSHFMLSQPRKSQREEFFKKVIDMIKSPPDAFPAEERRKRQMPVLLKAPVEVKTTTKEDLRRLKRADRTILNMLKIRLDPIMQQLKRVYKRFLKPPIEPEVIAYLFDEQDPEMISTDVERPYRLDKDSKGVGIIRETATNRYWYNLELITIERRLSNGYYKRPKDFAADIKRLARDASTSGDEDKILKANHMLANIQVDLDQIALQDPTLVAECEKVYEREVERGISRPEINVPLSETTAETSGPIILGEVVPGLPPLPNGVYSQPKRSPAQSHQSAQRRSESNGHWGDLDLDISGSSQVPDTQESPLSQSQLMPPPPRPTLVIDEAAVADAYSKFVHKSSGFSVEQLQQMNAQLMDSVWRFRGEWNRTTVLYECLREFNATIADIGKMQDILNDSQE